MNFTIPVGICNVCRKPEFFVEHNVELKKEIYQCACGIKEVKEKP